MRLSRTIILIGVASTFAIAMAGTAAAASLASGPANGKAGANTSTGSPCQIENDSGKVVSNDVEADQQNGKDIVYWIHTPARPKVSGWTLAVKSDEKRAPWSMTQQATALEFGNGFMPFGVPYWNGDATSGEYTVTVTYPDGEAPATCSFYVPGKG